MPHSCPTKALPVETVRWTPSCSRFLLPVVGSDAEGVRETGALLGASIGARTQSTRRLLGRVHDAAFLVWNWCNRPPPPTLAPSKTPEFILTHNMLFLRLRFHQKCFLCMFPFVSWPISVRVIPCPAESASAESLTSASKFCLGIEKVNLTKTSMTLFRVQTHPDNDCMLCLAATSCTKNAHAHMARYYYRYYYHSDEKALGQSTLAVRAASRSSAVAPISADVCASCVRIAPWSHASAP